MNLNQQNNQYLQQGNQAHFSPISSRVTNMGTTVSYSIYPQSNVNAFALHQQPSGTFSNYQQANLTQAGWNQFNQNLNNYNPLISANHLGQQVSGNIIAQNQFRLQQIQQNLVAQPGIDISETSSDVIVSAFVPNVPINDMNLNVTENSVTISGSAWTGNQNLLLSRTVALPTSVRAESVDANLKSGVLEIRLPKIDKNIAQRATITPNQTQL